MLAARLISTVILIPLLALLIRTDQQFGSTAPLFLMLCLAISGRGAWELKQLMTGRIATPPVVLTILLSCLVVLSAWLPVISDAVPHTLPAQLAGISAALIASVLLLLTYEAVRFRTPGHSLESLGSGLLTVLYCGGLTATTALLRWVPNEQSGFFALLSLIVCVKSGDTTAYCFGRLWGKRKMAPFLSPGKTWMGLAGAVCGSCAGAVCWFQFATRTFITSASTSGLLNVIAFGVVLGLTGLLGDLCESLLKRDCGKKDAAALMPGFGGLLDLVDSPIFTGPVALLWWLVIPPVQ